MSETPTETPPAETPMEACVRAKTEGGMTPEEAQAECQRIADEASVEASKTALTKAVTKTAAPKPAAVTPEMFKREEPFFFEKGEPALGIASVEDMVQAYIAKGFSPSEAKKAVIRKISPPSEAMLALEAQGKKPEDMNTFEKQMSLFEEAIENRMVDMLIKVDKMWFNRLSTITKWMEDRTMKTMKQTLGIDTDPVIHLSELPHYLRKIGMQQAGELGKKTVTSTPDKPAEGPEIKKNAKLPSSEEMFNNLTQIDGGPK